MSGWLDAGLWATIQESVPIACVDLLALSGTEHPKLGLIFRDTPHEGQRWCLIGGRILRNEKAHDAVRRHVEETLGPEARCDITGEQPLYVAEYFTDRRSPLVDPRQHAIALTYAGILSGDFAPSGEAHRFDWFSPSELPARDLFGFGQDAVLDALAPSLGLELGYGRA